MPAISIFEMRTLLPEAEVKDQMSHAQLAPPIYGLLAEFDTPTELVHATKAAYAAGYRKMDAYSPFPIEECQRGRRLPQEPRAPDRAARRHPGRSFRIRLAVLDQLHRLSAEYRREALSVLAGFYCPDVRIDDLVCRTLRCLRNVRLEWLADAAPPAFQRRSFCAGDPRQVFPVRGSRRSQFRSGEHGALWRA